jgi:hypothetical protein
MVVPQYFYSALRDCVRPMRATCHAESTDIVVRHFESEMIANVREVLKETRNIMFVFL